MKHVILLLAVMLCFPVSAFAQKIAKEQIVSQGKTRTYYLFVPEGISASKPAPLVVLLHGSNRNGLSLVEKWKDLAKKENFIIVGPDAAEPMSWALPGDGPVPLRELVESLRAKHPINPRRVYLFGHSAGAGFALFMSLLESEYYAATAIHAGALRPENFSLIEQAKRKTPIFIQVGTNDDSFPLATVRATRDALNARGFNLMLTEIPNHTHWYYDRAPKINAAAWEFLRQHELSADPRRGEHNFASARSNEAVDAYNRGLELHRKGDLTGAAAAYTSAVSADPEFAEAFTNRGAVHLDGKNYQAAIADLTRSIELKPTEAITYANRGTAYIQLKQTAEALTDYTKAIELKPSAEVYFNRGVLHDQAGSYALALTDYTRAVELNPKFATAHAYRGMILLRDGKDAEGQQALDAAFKLDPKLRADLEPYINNIRAVRGAKQP